MSAQEDFSQWKELASCELGAGVGVRKFRSERSGLEVAIADFKAPLVSAFIAFATPATMDNDPAKGPCDDGCPHTLEHLVFLGSERYPYKGILDELANRCLGQGTNAWTATDSTVYYISTAGKDGLLSMLPVYMDHTLFPTLSDAGFVTEVHHITGEGKDSGVVYCEMQGRENEMRSLCELSELRRLFQDTAYAAETGGLLKDLRSLTNDTIRAFHQRFYHASNTLLIITGDVQPEEVFRSLQQVEEDMNRKTTPEPTTPRPPISLPPLHTSQHSLLFPSRDESHGCVRVAWRGAPWGDFQTRLALSLVSDYLSQSAVSPLRKALVDIPEPLCGRVATCSYELANDALSFRFLNVPTARLELLVPALDAVLGELVQEEHWDMTRMRSVIRKHRRQYLEAMEKDPSEFALDVLLPHFLNGQHQEQIEASVQANLSKDLDAKDASFWSGLVRRFLAPGVPRVVTLARPSAEEATKIANEETARTDAQRQDLGSERLEQLQQLVADSDAHNCQIVPEEIIRSFAVPRVDSVSQIDVTTYRNGAAAGQVEGELAQWMQRLPFFMQLDSIPSSFVSLTAYLDTSRLPLALRCYLELYLEVVFESPLTREYLSAPARLSHDQVVLQLEDESVTYSNSLGCSGGNFMCGDFAQLALICLKFELEDYAKAVQWLGDILFRVEFMAERLKAAAKRLLSDVPERKRNGDFLYSALPNWLNFSASSNHAATNAATQATFLTTVLDRLEGSADQVQEVVHQVTSLREHLVALDSLRVHCAMDTQRVGAEHIVQPFLSSSFLPPSYSLCPFPSIACTPVQMSRELRKDKLDTARLLSVPSLDSNYVIQTAALDLSHDHPDVAALQVACELLTCCEGPLWKRIRGLGHAYGYRLRFAAEKGLLTFSLYKSAEPFAAYTEARKVVLEFVNGESAVTELAVQAARSGVVFEVVSHADTLHAAADQAFRNHLRMLPDSHTALLLQRVAAVTPEDVLRVLHDYVAPVFDVHGTSFCVVSNPQQHAAQKEHFASLGLHLVAATIDETFGHAVSVEL